MAAESTTKSTGTAKSRKIPFLELNLPIFCSYSMSLARYEVKEHDCVMYLFLRCSIYMILRHLKPPATANDFATCHVTLFGWRNGGLGHFHLAARSLVAPWIRWGKSSGLSQFNTNLRVTEGVTSRSVPATPPGDINGAASHLETPGTPHTPDTQGFGTRVSSQGPLQSHENPVNAGDLQASLSRLPPGQYDKGLSPFKLAQAGHDESLQVNILRTFLGVFY